MTIINQAKIYAKRAHSGQTYEDKPYFLHCKQTALILTQVTNDTNLIAAGYLHDILEQTETTHEDLQRLFNEDIADLVKEVTKTKYNTFPFLHSKRGVILKFADRLANLSHMESWDEGKQQRYIAKSKFWKSR